jgi:hypothetical protein
MKTQKITLTELRQLVKNIIKEENEKLNEYDRESFNRKYTNIPNEKKEKINKYSVERQKRDGIKFYDKENKNNIYSVSLSDISLRGFDKDFVNAYSKFPEFINKLKKYNYDIGSLLRNENSAKYFNNIFQYNIYDGKTKNSSENMGVSMRGTIRSVVGEFGDNTYEGSDITLDIYISCVLEKITDKYISPINLRINGIQLSDKNGEKDPKLPLDNNSRNKFYETIKGLIINMYGKYNPNNPIFIKNVEIDRNAFYK